MVRSSAPWFNTALKESNRSCKHLERTWRKNYNPNDRLIYKQALKAYFKQILEAKKYFLSAKIERASNKNKDIFKIVSDFSAPAVVAKSFTPTEAWTSRMVSYFHNKVVSIQESFPPTPPVQSEKGVHNSPKLQATRPSFEQFPMIPLEKTLEVLKGIKSGSPSDPCPAHILASTADIINPVVNQILNLSLKMGQIPDRWKRAKILPLLKKTTLDPELASNYRPISLLPFFSKALEKVVNNVTTEFVETNSLLHQSQSGFRANFSTETALLEVSKAIKEVVDGGGKAILILLDLSAAFDTIPHDRLLLRLRECGFGGTVLNWFSAFLKNRHLCGLHRLLPLSPL